MRRGALVPGWCLCCLAVAAADSERAPIPESVLDWRDSVAQLEIVQDGKLASRGTGFVTADRSGNLILVTAAHVLKGQLEAAAYLPEYGQQRPFVVIALSHEYDLAILRPEVPLKKTRPIPLSKVRLIKSADVGKTWTFMIGSPNGMSLGLPRGFIDADPETWESIADKIVPDPLDRASLIRQGHLHPLRNDMQLVRHQTVSAAGLSGAPTFDENGRLIGIHHGVLGGTSNVCFCIPAEYIAKVKQLPLEKRVVNTRNPTPIGIKEESATPIRVEKTLLGMDLGLLSCYQQGVFKGTAQELIDGMIRNPPDFEKFIAPGFVSSLMKQKPICQITNPGLGFQFLVPDKTLVNPRRMPDGNGVVVTLSNNKVIDDKWFDFVRIYVYKNEYADDLLRQEAIEQREKFDAMMKKYKIRAPTSQPPPKFTLPPTTKGSSADLGRFLRGFQFESRFIEKVLGLKRDFSPPSKSQAKPRPATDGVLEAPYRWKDPKGRLYRYTSVYSPTDRQYGWRRISLDAIDGSDAHSVDIAAHGRLLVVVHYRFKQSDRNALLKRDKVNLSFLERAFIARSVSLY